MPAASFQPQTIDLSASFVQLIRTALSNPKVTLDKTGLKSFDANGNPLVAINADGTASFQGLISALGANLPLAPGSGPALQNQLTWSRQSDGALVLSQFAAQGGAGQPVTFEILLTPPEDDTSKIIISAENFLATKGGASLVLNGGSVKGSANNNAKIQLAQAFATILDDTGASSFLQKANNLSDLASIATALANLGIAFGTGLVNWPGTSTFSSTAVINHGLGAIPRIAAAGDNFNPATDAGLAHNPVFVAASKTAASFQVNGEVEIANPAAGATRSFWWLAIK